MDRGDRGWVGAGGVGGLVFAGAVLTANALRGEPPMADAAPEVVVAYYRDHAGALALSRAAFGLDVPFLLAFAAGTHARLRAHAAAEPLARVGATMVMVMTATFGQMLALDATLGALAAGDASAEAVGPLWRLHTAVMVVNGVVLSGALGAFSLASLRAGVGPRWLAWIGATGAGCGFLGAAPLDAVLAGSPLGLLGLVAFLTWLLFVLGTSVSHLRAARDLPAAAGAEQGAG